MRCVQIWTVGVSKYASHISRFLFRRFEKSYFVLYVDSIGSGPSDGTVQNSLFHHHTDLEECQINFQKYEVALGISFALSMSHSSGWRHCTNAGVHFC